LYVSRRSLRLLYFSQRAVNDWNRLPQSVVDGRYIRQLIQEPAWQVLDRLWAFKASALSAHQPTSEQVSKCATAWISRDVDFSPCCVLCGRRSSKYQTRHRPTHITSGHIHSRHISSGTDYTAASCRDKLDFPRTRPLMTNQSINQSIISYLVAPAYSDDTPSLVGMQAGLQRSVSRNAACTVSRWCGWAAAADIWPLTDVIHLHSYRLHYNLHYRFSVHLQNQIEQ